MIQTLASNINSTIPNVAPNDIYLTPEGNIALSFDLQAIVEQCSQVARTLLGEMVLNTDIGLPYFQTLWGGSPNIAQFIAALRQSFLNVNGVVEVLSIETTQGDLLPNDTLSYTATIRTTFGIGVING